MAVLFCDGFPYDTASLTTPVRWSSYSNSYSVLTVETASGRSGGRFMKFKSYPQISQPFSLWITKQVAPAGVATICVQFGLITYNPWFAPSFFYIVDSSSEQLHLYLNANTIYLYRGATLLATASVALQSQTWQQIEFKATIHGSAGTALLKIDGQQAFSISGANTQSTAHAYATGIQFGFSGTGNQNLDVYGISDLIVMDTTGSYCNDLLGSRIVKPCVPLSNGNYAEWSPSAGQNYACVDEIPPNGDTDYNATGLIGKNDTFAVTQVPANVNIAAVVADMYCKTDGVGTMKGIARHGGSDGLGPAGAIPASYNWIQSPIYVNPSTGNPFTAAEFNAAEFGYRRDT